MKKLVLGQNSECKECPLRELLQWTEFGCLGCKVVMEFYRMLDSLLQDAELVFRTRIN